MSPKKIALNDHFLNKLEYQIMSVSIYIEVYYYVISNFKMHMMESDVVKNNVHDLSYLPHGTFWLGNNPWIKVDGGATSTHQQHITTCHVYGGEKKLETHRRSPSDHYVVHWANLSQVGWVAHEDQVHVAFHNSNGQVDAINKAPFTLQLLPLWHIPKTTKPSYYQGVNH